MPGRDAGPGGCSRGCDDGLFCNGVELCIDAECVAGTPPCDDGLSCTDDTCSELTHTCADAAHGVTSLGLGAKLPEARVAEAIRALLPKEVRAAARARMASVDLWSGPDRIMTAILGLLRARRLRDRALRAQQGLR